MSALTPEAVAAGLYCDTRDLLLMCPPDRWFSAAEIRWSRPGPTGHALSRMATGLLMTRRSDPKTRGRSQYHVSEFGLQVRALLERNSA